MDHDASGPSGNGPSTRGSSAAQHCAEPADGDARQQRKSPRRRSSSNSDGGAMTSRGSPRRTRSTLVISILTALIATTFLWTRSESEHTVVHSEVHLKPAVGKIGKEINSTHTAGDGRRNAERAIEPLWACTDSPRERRKRGLKMGFVHVFKAAGSTMSTLFTKYSEQCLTGYGRLIHCNEARHKSILGNGTWKHCHLKYGVSRKGKFFSYKNREDDNVKNSFLQGSLDIIAGHYKIGAIDHLSDEIRYTTFIRDAAAKFVSGKVFTRGKQPGRITASQLVDEIKEFIVEQVSKGRYHNKYATYLITPWQLEKVGKLRDDEQSVRRATKMVLQNLDKYNVLVGVVERMSESMELYQHILDPDSRTTMPLFESFGMRNATGHVAASTTSNKSPVSASVMLKEIRKDKEVSKKLDEYVKYEKKITDYALRMHLDQYGAMKRQKLSRSHKEGKKTQAFTAFAET